MEHKNTISGMCGTASFFRLRNCLSSPKFWGTLVQVSYPVNGKAHPRTGHECSLGGSKCITLFFL